MDITRVCRFDWNKKYRCLAESFGLANYSVVKCLAPISEAKALANRSAIGMGLMTRASRTNFLIRANDADMFESAREPVERPSLITIRSIAGYRSCHCRIIRPTINRP